jgi:hypothetical protein
MFIANEGFVKKLYIVRVLKIILLKFVKNNLLAITIVSIPFQLFTCKFFGSCPSTAFLTTNVGEGVFWLDDGLKLM